MTKIKGVITCFLILCGVGLGSINHVYCQETKEKSKNDFKQSLSIAGNFVRANLETHVSFTGSNNLLSVNIGLEENLGLESSKMFFVGNAFWRITYRSGVFASYYRIHRKKEYTVRQDIPFLDKLIPEGTEVSAYFNTNVLSLGYVFSIVNDAKSYLGAYGGLFLISLNTGVDSEGITLNENTSLMAPLPNFGLVTNFQVTSWFDLNSKFGIFYLRLDDFSGKINDFSIAAKFKPTPWLGLNLGYKVFDVAVEFYTGNIKTTAEYNFRGPALGAVLTF